MEKLKISAFCRLLAVGIFVLSVSPSLVAFGQDGVLRYESVPSDDALIVQDSVIIPVKAGKKNLYHISALGEPGVARVFDPKVDGVITFEDDYMYAHVSGELRKYNRFTRQLLWTADYGPSKWNAQWEPFILNEKYISAIVDDHIALVDKESGKLVLNIKGKDFEDGISLSGNYLICTKFNGRTWAVDIATGKKVWSVDVGETAGYGNVTDNGRIYLPSWDPKFFCLDQKTGKKIWVLDLSQYKYGCGSGFEEAPVLKGDKLYAVHRDQGLFVIDKHSGEVLQHKDDFGDIVDNIILYKEDYLLFMDTDYLYIYSISKDDVYKKIPLPIKMRTGIILKGNHLIATQDVVWKDSPYEKGVVTFDLETILEGEGE